MLVFRFTSHTFKNWNGQMLKKTFFLKAHYATSFLQVFQNYTEITSKTQGRKNEAHARIVRLPGTKSSIEENETTCT